MAMSETMNIFALLGGFIVIGLVFTVVSMVERGHADVLVFLVVVAGALITGGVYITRRIRRAFQGAFARHSLPRI
jgi:uncharacterized membrane protein